MDTLTFFALYLAVVMYILMVWLFFYKESLKRKKTILFHNAILSVYSRAKSSDNNVIYNFKDILEQLTLNYNKIFQNEKESNKTMMLDMLEQIIFYYDAYTNENFERRLRIKKNIEIRDFIFNISQCIKESDPFSALPAKDAALLKNIDDALSNSNIQLGKTAIEQLTTEIVNKESIIKKQERNNQIATILSIVGLVLTIFFGILSIF